MKELVLAVLFLLLAGCSPNESPTPSPSPSPTQTRSPTPSPGPSSSPTPASTPTLSWAGFGPVRFGMKANEAEAVAGPRTDPGRELGAECDYLQFASLPGVRFMVESGVITRGDAGPDVINSLGIAVGAKLEVVQAAHPEARITPHKYDPTGHYVLFAAPDGKAGIVMEEQNGAIVRIRAGLEPAVEYVESCS